VRDVFHLAKYGRVLGLLTIDTVYNRSISTLSKTQLIVSGGVKRLGVLHAAVGDSECTLTLTTVQQRLFYQHCSEIVSRTPL